jgi:dTMP kinase
MAEKERGRFIVFEGIDGSGKSTQIRMLAEKLKENGREVYMTAEPTATVSGGLLRDALSGVSKRSACELAALFLLDRINHNVTEAGGIERMLRAGYDVICDRYYYSSIAYQGSETDFEWVKTLNVSCPEIRRPDLCIFLDLDPDTSLARIEKGRAVTEIFEEKEKLEAVRASYRRVFDSLGDRENIKIVDASGTPEEISKEIINAVLAL